MRPIDAAPTDQGQLRKRLKQAYREQGLALVLGAGVSTRSGVPDWAGLLRQTATGIEEAGADLFDELAGARWTLPAIAGLLQRLAGGPERFAEVIRASIYRAVPGIRRRTRKRLDNSAFLQGASANHTLEAVGAFCVRRGQDGTFEPNPRLRAIVTFNLDALLQVYVTLQYGDGLLRTIDRASGTRSPNHVNVYHAHGFLRFEHSAAGVQVARPDLSVITEDQYFDFYNRPNEVFSYTFLQVLRDWPCLFIGLSMTDDNVRRLLYYSYRERRTSYEREGRAPDQAHAASVRHFALFGPQVSDRLRRVTQQGLTQLGVSTIWLDRFDDLPTLMQDVYCTSGEEWPGGMPGKRSCVRRDERPA